MKPTTPPPANLGPKQPAKGTSAPPVYRPQPPKSAAPAVYRPSSVSQPASKPLLTAPGSSKPAQRKPLASVAVLRKPQANSGGATVIRSRTVQASRVVQRFPYTIKHKTQPLQLIARWENPNIVLYRNGIEVGYLKIKTNGTVWELKDILVDGSMRGQDIGSILVYLFAASAHAAGATGLSVLLPNGTGLYRRNGFTITPNAINPANPPTIDGLPNTVRTAAQGVVAANFEIRVGLPQPARQPPPAAAPQLINNNTYGNPQIGDDQL